MPTVVDPARIRAAWEGRVSGCLLGKPLEVMSYQAGPEGLADYLGTAGALPLRNYVPAIEETPVAKRWLDCCRPHITRFEPDDDVNYTILSLLLLEEHGTDFQVADVARAWLNRLPAGKTWTAERAAYGHLLGRMDAEFVNGGDAGFDLADCADNEFNEWIGAQIRADLYGWVSPGQPECAAELATRDGSLSHVGEGLNGAAFVAALGAAIQGQFQEWGLSQAEGEVSLLLMKGHSHKSIARLTDRSPQTVRQHASVVYRKSGLSGRAELAAFFLEDLMLPGEEAPSETALK